MTDSAIAKAITTLPAAAPKVRVSTGESTTGSKSWVLKRPVTLLGSQRKSHIVLRGVQVERAHCVIINTGWNVLLKDLHTTHGTFLNGERINLVELSDGDELVVGSSRVRVSITAGDPDQVGSLPFIRGTLLRTPFNVGLDGSRERWTIQEAVSLVGSSLAEVRIQDESMLPAHAIMFGMVDGLALYDLSGGSTLLEDGSVASLARLAIGDVIQLGESRLWIGAPRSDRNTSAVPRRMKAGGAPTIGFESAPPKPANPYAPSNSFKTPDAAKTPQASASPVSASPNEGATGVMAELSEVLAGLRLRVDESWKRLNDGDSLGLGAGDLLSPDSQNIGEVLELLNQTDAALRGHLHDLTQLLEKVVLREQEITAQGRRIHEERLKLFRDQAEWASKKGQIDRQAEEIQELRQKLGQDSSRRNV